MTDKDTKRLANHSLMLAFMPRHAPCYVFFQKPVFSLTTGNDASYPRFFTSILGQSHDTGDEHTEGRATDMQGGDPKVKYIFLEITNCKF